MEVIKLRRLLKSAIPNVILPYARYVHRMTKGVNRSKNRQMLNMALAMWGKEEINYVPSIFNAYITMLCNLRCPNCQYIIRDSEALSGNAFMRVDDLENVVEEYLPHIDAVNFGGGEPLLHPQFDQLVDIVWRKDIPLNISTNGILVEERLESLQLFRRVNVSVDGYDHASYRKYRGGRDKDFDRVLRGLRLLRESGVNLTISFVMSEENLHEIREVLRFAHDHQPGTLVLHSINPHGSNDFAPLIITRTRVRGFLEQVLKKSDYPFSIKLPVIFDPDSPTFLHSKCTQLWDRVCFDEKGDIAYCCQLRHDPAIGNMFDGSYDFNSDLMKMMRRKLIESTLPVDCLFCHRRFWEKHYGIFHSVEKKWELIGDTGGQTRVESGGGSQ